MHSSAERVVDSPLRVWLLAARPKTLPAGIVPVLVAGAMAYADGGFHLLSLLAALFGSIMIQIGTNYANDLFDYLKKTDTTERIGPTRVTQSGMATPKQTAIATTVVFSLALLAGIYLVYRGGWPIVIIGLVSIACGILYTAGPLALGYIGLADIFVLIFFGPVALAGTYYVQTLDMSWTIIIAGVPFGMISTALLTVNNLRDIATDSKSGKKTLAVRYGRTFAQWEYAIMMAGAAVVPAAMVFANAVSSTMTLPILYIIFTGASVRAVFSTTDGVRLNSTLAATGRLLILYGLLFAMGWML